MKHARLIKHGDVIMAYLALNQLYAQHAGDLEIAAQ